MEEMEDQRLKTEINDISQRIDDIIKTIDRLDPVKQDQNSRETDNT